MKSKLKKIDAITNQNQDDDHKDDYKTVFEGLVKERFDEIKQLTHEINQNYLIYYFKSNTSSKRFDGFNNSTELFKKMKWSQKTKKKCRMCLN